MLGGSRLAPQENFESYFFVDGILGHFGMIFISQMHFNIA